MVDNIEVDKQNEIDSLPESVNLSDSIRVATAMTLAQPILIWDEDKFLALAPCKYKKPLTILYD